MKSLGLARIILDGRHVAGLKYALDDARLAASLVSSGLPSKLYSGKSEGRVLDIARQLVRARTDAYLFAVSPETLGVSCQIANALTELRPDMQLLFWGEVDGANAGLVNGLAGKAQLIPGATLEAAVAAVLRIAGLAAPSPVPAVSPYLTGLLGPADAARLGITSEQPHAMLRDELAWLARSLSGPETIPFSAQSASADELRQICASIQDLQAPLRFELHVAAAACTSEFFTELKGEHIARLVIDGELATLPPEALAFKDIIARGEGEEQKVARALIYGKNGSVAMHAGLYFDAKQTPGIYHLELPLGSDKQMREDIYAWAGPNLDIKSAAVLKGSVAQVDQLLSTFVAPASEETGGWPKHSYAIGSGPQPSQSRITFDGVVKTQQAMRHIRLSQLGGHKALPGEMTFIAVEDEADVDELVNRLDNFHATGAVTLVNDLQPSFFENSCRWMGGSACRLPLMRRLSVDHSMNLKSCRDAGEVGKVGDSYDQIVIRAKLKQQSESIRRDCSTCPVRDSCSQCAQLPEVWGGRYCNIRKSYPQIALYVEVLSVAHRVFQMMGNEAAEKLDFKVSCKGLPSQHYHGAVGKPRDGAQPIIFSTADKHYLMQRGVPKMLKLSAPMAMMVEGWWAGAQEESISESLANRFNVDLATARASLAEGMGKLHAGGCLN